MKPKLQKIVGTLKRWNNVFCDRMTCKTNLKRDIFLTAIAIVISGAIVFGGKFDPAKEDSSEKVAGVAEVKVSEEEIYQEVKTTRETVDTAGWKALQSQWYGIEVKYPSDWLSPKVQAVPRGAAWEYRYQFRKKIAEENDPYAGFDLAIYNLTKIKELSDTAEFPKLKSDAPAEDCASFTGYLVETGDYPAEEIYVPSADDCYDPALFFSFTKDQYIYNIVPVAKETSGAAGDPHVETIDHFPEFFGVASTMKIIDIVRPRPVAVAPRITAPKPAAETRKDSLGRMICKSGSDRPQKSNKGKGKHLDMECCLDPDEYPNPWCYYDPAKYGKYLK